MILEIETEADFENNLAINDYVVADFTATFCQPCKIMNPVFETLMESYKYVPISFVKIDVEKVSSVAKTQAIVAMPTFITYKRGVEHGRMQGADKKGLEALIRRLIF